MDSNSQTTSGFLVERRLELALGRFAPRIRKVALTFSDVNSFRGGIDKECRIIAWVDGLEELFVEDEDASIPALTDLMDPISSQPSNRRRGNSGWSVPLVDVELPRHGTKRSAPSWWN